MYIERFQDVSYQMTVFMGKDNDHELLLLHPFNGVFPGPS